MVNLFAYIQCVREVNSYCTNDFSSLKSDPDKKQFVSSANNSQQLIVRQDSFIYFVRRNVSPTPLLEKGQIPK